MGNLGDILDLGERFEVKSTSNIVLVGAVNLLLGEYYVGEDDEMVGEEEMRRRGTDDNSRNQDRKSVV